MLNEETRNRISGFWNKKQNVVYWLVAIVVLTIGALFMTVLVIGAIVQYNNPSKPRAVDESLYFESSKVVTEAGTNAEAYWSKDGQQIIYQAKMADDQCDKIYIMNVDGTNKKRVDKTGGFNTCSYFLNDPNYILYSTSGTTYGENGQCPPKADRELGYVWPLYDTNINLVNVQTSEVVAPITNDKGVYNAEGTLSPDRNWLVYTSTRDGDLELYKLYIGQSTNGSSNGKPIVEQIPTRLTFTPGYDGGAFFSHDGSKIVYRSNRPSSTEALVRYQTFIKAKIAESQHLEIYVMNADGSNQQRITHTPESVVNFSPYFMPNDEGIIFSSNREDPRVFHLYIMDIHGNHVTRITEEGSFNSFPMFSPDGQYLIYSSNRDTKNPYDMNIVVAKWKPFSFPKQSL
eukprot:CAMPEP_0117421296 /NCGR_PEP_ID=MMETSP0758-20121206/2430_1 /TAXON_ID=63605 /ORGANISM="Percolomonas cosmopolitus, Strain AE-1 (ATCC 50343)" /LENGTH=401 /DNA_ID=CAMNT_0005203363 /DNA_START=26 /DNA_END=1231 /DNA_ORIENTATION=+